LFGNAIPRAMVDAHGFAWSVRRRSASEEGAFNSCVDGTLEPDGDGLTIFDYRSLD
jgi:hypothetical protein